jgi:glycosyltransferase involved in cell wall biosynthesis
MGDESLLKYRVLRDLLADRKTVDQEIIERLVSSIHSNESALDFTVRTAKQLLSEQRGIADWKRRSRSILRDGLSRTGRPVRRLMPETLKKPLRGVLRSLKLRPALHVKNQKLSFRGDKVAVASTFRTPCEIGRGAELMVRDFRARGVEVVAIDLTNALGQKVGGDFPDLSFPSQLGELKVSDLIVHINPPDFLRALMHFDPQVLNNTALIGYWAWGLPVVSQEWRDAARYCDELWVPSPFVAETLSSGIPRFRGPIKVVPYAVAQDPLQAPTMDQRLAVRREYDIELSKFVVGYSFSFDSNYSRKNPTAVIDAFRFAFPDDEGCCLVIQCEGVKAAPRLFEHLVKYAGSDPRIRIVNLDRHQFPIRDFYWCLDVYLSPFRSEGHGLSLVEAAQAGASVIATGWGLSPEIASTKEVTQIGYRLVPPIDPQGFYDRFEGAVWAEPDLMDAARELKRLRERHPDRSPD